MREILMGFFTAALALAIGGARESMAQAPPLQVAIVLERAAFEPGKPLSFSVEMQNVSSRPVTLTFATTQRFDVTLESDVIEIDRWSRNQSFARVSGELHWRPGQTRSFSVWWLPRSRFIPTSVGAPTEQPLTRGVFGLRARLLANEAQLSSPVALVIIGQPVALPAGCTELPELLSAELPVELLVRTVEPPDALTAIWQRALFRGVYTAYTPRVPVVSDLRTLNQRFAVTLCMSNPATFTPP